MNNTTAPTGLTASGIAGMFTQLFARRKQETALDLRDLLKRRIEGEDVPDDQILQAALEVGLDGPAVDKMAQRIALRRAHRAMAAERPGIEKELENVSRQIKALEDEWTEFRSSYITKLTPLAEKKQEIEARLGNANAAADAILDLQSLEPEMAERLRATREKRGLLKVQAQRTQSELHSARDEVHRVKGVLKEKGIDLRALGFYDKEKRPGLTPHILGEHRADFELIQYHLRNVEAIPGLEETYRTTVAELEPLEAQVIALEKEAWDS